MKSDNKTKGMGLNRFLANPIVILIRIIVMDIVLFAVVFYIVNSIGNIGEYISAGADGNNFTTYFGAKNLLPAFSKYSTNQKLVLLAAALLIFGLNALDFYKTRISYSENDINQGQYGTRRWTTRKEIRQQFKAVPLKKDQFDGKPGFPISRIKNKIYVDDALTNCLGLGSTRSGKGQGSIVQDIDIASRARDIKNRPSLIIADPKTENSRMMARTLEKRGYTVRFLNLAEPSRSMGFNPMRLVIDYYKKGQNQKAQMAAKSFSFSIFNASDDVGQEPIWKNTATDLFTALMVAITSDCVELDNKVNEQRRRIFRQKRAEYMKMPDDKKAAQKKVYHEMYERFCGRELEYIKLATTRMIDFTVYDETCGIAFRESDSRKLQEIKDKYTDKIQRQERKEDISYYEDCFTSEITAAFGDMVVIPQREDIEDMAELRPIDDPVLSAYIEGIPDEAAFFDVRENEKKVNAFSCILFFQDMCNRAASESDGGEDFEQKAETAMDEYFNARPQTDYAKSLYLEIKSAGSKTKGSVYINMQSALSTFVLHDIAQMTAESDFDIESLGYGDAPVAVFLVIPSEDRSNHFIATTFIAQVYRYLFELAKSRAGKLDRNVIFVLDEFGNLPVIENYAGMVTVGLGMGIAFHIYIQSYGQIYGKYKDDAQAILDNFATQQYIMSIGNESAEEFSKKVGQTTVITMQRSGGRFSKDKTYTESVSQRPLIYEHELAVLREGESVIIRNLKRTDTLGVAVEAMPIINEYMDNLPVYVYIRVILEIFINRIIKRKAILNPKDKSFTSISQEWRIRINGYKRYLGTDALFAYQYLLDDFPSPDSVDFNDVCRESRKHINITKRIYKSDEVLERLKDERQNKKDEALMAQIKEMSKEYDDEAVKKTELSEKTLKELSLFSRIKEELSKRLEDKGGYDVLRIDENTPVSVAKERIEGSSLLSVAAKKYIISLMREGEGNK